MLYPDWLWKRSIGLLCLIALLCPDLEGLSFDNCATEDGRPGICVVKIYCRESNSQQLLKCEGDDSYCCPIPTSAAETPKRPPDGRTRGDSAPKRPAEGRYGPPDRSKPRDDPDLDDYESRYASGSARPFDEDKPGGTRGSSNGKPRDTSGYYPVSSGPVRPGEAYPPRESYHPGGPSESSSGPARPEQNRPRETYDSVNRKPLGSSRPSYLDSGEPKNPRDTHDSDNRKLSGSSRPSFLDPDEPKGPRDTYDSDSSKRTKASRRGSSDPLRPDESNRKVHDSDNRRPQAPPRPRPYDATGPRDANDSDRTGYNQQTGQSRPRTQETDQPRAFGDNERRGGPVIRFPGDKTPPPPRQREDDVSEKGVHRNEESRPKPPADGGRQTKDSRGAPPGRDHSRGVEPSSGPTRDYDEPRRHPPERREEAAKFPAKKESDHSFSRTPPRLPDLAPKPKVPACGVRPYDLFIAGGTVSDAHEWPWMAAIFRRFQDSRPKAFLCGGSLISSRFVLTAAHCFVNNYVILPASSFVVRLGSNYLDSGEEYVVADLILHHNHSGSDYFNDIALIRLAGQVIVTDKIAPICLPPPDMQHLDMVGRMATVAGWGDVAYRTSGTRVLQHVTIPVVSNQECSSAYSRVRGAAFLARGTDHVICAGLKEGGKDACLGDSGGPLMLKLDGERWVVIGIVSLGYKCAEPGYYGVYTRVTHYTSWIGGHTKQRH